MCGWSICVQDMQSQGLGNIPDGCLGPLWLPCRT